MYMSAIRARTGLYRGINMNKTVSAHRGIFARKVFALLCLLAALALLFAACQDPAYQETGTVTLTFGDSSTARWSNGPLNNPNIERNLVHEIDLWNGNSYDTHYGSTITLGKGTTSKKVTGVPLGNLKVEVRATLRGYDFAYGDKTITVVAGDNNQAPVNMERIQNGIVLSIDKDCSHTFTSLPPGYLTSDLSPLTVDVDNFAENATGFLSVTLGGTDAGSFTLGGTTSIANISQDNKATFTVKPNNSLAAGTYTATVKVESATGGTISETFTVSFTVSPGDGSPTDPFKVYNDATLRQVGTGTPTGWTLDKCYEQTADITLSGTFPAIGSSSSPFTGTYNGGNKKILLLNNAGTSASHQGMFAAVGSGGTVKNVTLDNCTIEGTYAVGGVVGYNEGTVQDCSISGPSSTIKATNEDPAHVIGSAVGGVVGDNSGTVDTCNASVAAVTGTAPQNFYSKNIGGVVGLNSGVTAKVLNSSSAGPVTGTDVGTGGVVGYNDSGIVDGCYHTGTVTGTQKVGGVAGNNLGTVKNSYATGTVTGTIEEIGGVAGNNSGTVEYCYYSGTVTGGTNNSVGGVVGISNYGTVQNCYSSGSVTGTSVVGGVVGYSGGTVQNCYSISAVSADNVVGGVVGYNDGGTVQNCYATGIITATRITIGTDIGGVVGKHSGGTVKNCVALNPNIAATIGDWGRVVGTNDYAIANCYARDDMKQGGTPPTPGTWTNIGATGIDGVDITSTNWGVISWWTSTMKFNDGTTQSHPPATDWVFTGLGATKGPTLDNMPSGTQSATIP